MKWVERTINKKNKHFNKTAQISEHIIKTIKYSWIKNKFTVCLKTFYWWEKTLCICSAETEAVRNVLVR